jgi:beta-xylosidase
MEALQDFEVTVTFCYTPEHRGIMPHHTSPPQAKEEFAEFCAAMIERYAPQTSVAPEPMTEAASRSFSAQASGATYDLSYPR